MGRFNKTKYGYIYDKYIFRTMLLLIYIYAIWVLAINDFDFSFKPYLLCEGSQPCENPFYEAECYYLGGFITKSCDLKCENDWCSQEYVLPGEYGKKTPNYIKNFGFTYFIIVLIALLLNHYLHNKGKMFDIEYSITKKKKVNFRDFFKKFDELEEY